MEKIITEYVNNDKHQQALNVLTSELSKCLHNLLDKIPIEFLRKYKTVFDVLVHFLLYESNNFPLNTLDNRIDILYTRVKEHQRMSDKSSKHTYFFEANSIFNAYDENLLYHKHSNEYKLSWLLQHILEPVVSVSQLETTDTVYNLGHVLIHEYNIPLKDLKNQVMEACEKEIEKYREQLKTLNEKFNELHVTNATLVQELKMVNDEYSEGQDIIHILKERINTMETSETILSEDVITS